MNVINAAKQPMNFIDSGKKPFEKKQDNSRSTKAINSGNQPIEQKQDDVLARIDAMKSQESKNYKFTRYSFLPPAFSANDENDDDSSTPPEDLPDDPTDALCRTIMVDWSFSVADRCGFSRSNVFIATSNLDRYLATPAGFKALRDRREFQLACIAALYSAIKIHEVETLTAKGLARVSRGGYTAEEIEQTEFHMLSALDWQVSPPSPTSFVEQYVNLLHLFLQEQDVDDKVTIYYTQELTKHTFIKEADDKVAKYYTQELMKHTLINAINQIQLAAREYSFVGINGSSIALAAVLNALTTAEAEIIVYDIEAIKEQFCTKLDIEPEFLNALCHDIQNLLSASSSSKQQESN